MDTEKTFLVDENFSIDWEELSENDLKIVKHFIEATRHLQEIHHLFFDI